MEKYYIICGGFYWALLFIFVLLKYFDVIEDNAYEFFINIISFFGILSFILIVILGLF